jgi:hypothetical protein
MKVFRVAVALLSVTAVMAGPSVAQEMLLGVSGGANLSAASVQVDATTVDTESRTGFNFSGILGVQVSPVVGIHVEGQFSMKGFDMSAPESGLDTGLKLLYLDFPVLAVFTLPLGSNSVVAPRLFAGPNLGLRITCRLTEGAGPVGTGECDPDAARTVDFGVLAGAGVKFGKGQGGLFLDASVDYGLTNVNKSAANVSVKNRAFMVSLGFLFPII